MCVEDIYASQVLYIYLYTVLSLARSALPNILTGRQVIVLAAVFSLGVRSVSSAQCAPKATSIDLLVFSY